MSDAANLDKHGRDAGARHRARPRQEGGLWRPWDRKRCLRGARRAWWRAWAAIVQRHRVIRARPTVLARARKYDHPLGPIAK